MRWTLLYIVNGFKKAAGEHYADETFNAAGLLVPDCLERDAEGKALHGWELKAANEGTNRKNIKRATTVSAKNRYYVLFFSFLYTFMLTWLIMVCTVIV